MLNHFQFSISSLLVFTAACAVASFIVARFAVPTGDVLLGMWVAVEALGLSLLLSYRGGKRGADPQGARPERTGTWGVVVAVKGISCFSIAFLIMVLNLSGPVYFDVVGIMMLLLLNVAAVLVHVGSFAVVFEPRDDLPLESIRLLSFFSSVLATGRMGITFCPFPDFPV